MPLVPYRFLFRVAYPCRYVPDVPLEDRDDLLDLPPECRLDNFDEMDGRRNFANVRLAWNEGGLALQVEVRGKAEPPAGDPARPRQSDGITLWLDTRDARTSHRASRYCHQFHLLAAGGGPEHDQPAFLQTKIHRAMQDAPQVAAAAIAFHGRPLTGGYRLEAFLPATALHGFDPEQNPRLGMFYAVHDRELGEQTLGVGSDFPFGEDPSLWSVLELARPATTTAARGRSGR
jgi:hypothetical protein